ncbi:DotU family type IV/VI secretion system protein [Ralstonia sp. GX3-BWBA]|uniref:DotU family type IV/VI secretion system protein n=1 Tax=Ralstonia sp. GX3-BWBA TaxID=2219865 RepID=UPI000DD49332|nr:DotU family type IV/VI secretion system protein [Ralstonia sp. GX3-BWBA]
MDDGTAARLPVSREVWLMASQPQSKNHLLRLAQPLFWLLDELSPELESAARLDALKSEVRTRLAAFKQAAQAAALKADSVEAVHYCFCAALDQAGSRVRGRADGLRGVWLQHGLLMQLYGEKDFGQRCRTWITKLQETPNVSENALEVIAQLMGRGLRDERGMPLPKIQLVHQLSPVEVIPLAATTPQRRHVTIANSATEHQRIHVAVNNPSNGAVEPSDVLITVGIPVPEAPSSQELPLRRPWRLIVIAVVVTALVLGLAWVTYRQHLDNQALASQVSAQEAQVAKRQEPLEDRIARALTSETGASQFGLSTEGDRIYIVFSSDMSFAAGSADITPMLARQLERLAGVLTTTDGKVTIVGHTDDSPGALGRTETNLALSAARAMAVGRNLQAHGVAETRLSAMGRGAKEQVGDNKTAEGRALNRRVEIVLDCQRASVPDRVAPTTAGD